MEGVGMSNIRKLKNEIRGNGFTAATRKVFWYIRSKTEKFHIDNLAKSFKVLSSKDDILVHWSEGNNFGDALNPILIKLLFGKNAFQANKIINIRNKPVYTVIGSILEDLNYRNLEIWGTGFMFEDGKLIRPPKAVHAVRGPLTRQVLMKQGIYCPEIYGDPGLLLPFIHIPVSKRKYRLGIVPHYVDKDSSTVRYLKEKYKEEILIIDVQNNWEKVVEDINSCEAIASSSLHGIIAADAYGIPSLWIKLSDKVLGGKFKFHDYILSVGRKQMEPLLLDEEHKLIDILNSFEDYKIQIDLHGLLDSCPFKDK